MSGVRSGWRVRRALRSVVMTALAAVVAIALVAPIAMVAITAFQTQEQISDATAPPWPAKPAVVEIAGKTYDVYRVPIDGALRDLALVKPGRSSSQFLDPAAPAAPVITWEGSWRTLDRTWTLSVDWSNFAGVWKALNFPRLLFNTIAITVLSTIGTLLSCTLVAYGFARFRFRGRGVLFGLLVATIFVPAAATIIPTYFLFLKLGWVGTWLPILVPRFFANAYDVFLLRQFFLTIPRELDEAAMVDGAGPLRILRSIVLPSAMPAIVAVAVFHVVYAWNDYFAPLIYLSAKPELQPLTVGLAAFKGIYQTNAPFTAAGTLMTLALPVLFYLVFQRVFVRGGVVVSGVDK